MRILLAVFMAAFLTGRVWATNAGQAEQQIRDQFKTSIQDMEINSVRPAPIDGWYEVVVGAKLIYTTADGRYVLDGSLMDIKEQRNLSESPRLAARAAALARMGEKAIEFAPAGKTEHVLYVFTDVDCTYCRKMHNEVNELNAAGIAVRYLAFPRAGPGSRTFNTMVSVWCSGDPKQTLTDAKAGKTVTAANCDNPIKAQFDMGRSMGVHGTPSVMMENGDEIGGYVPAKEIIKMFKGGAS